MVHPLVTVRRVAVAACACLAGCASAERSRPASDPLTDAQVEAWCGVMGEPVGDLVQGDRLKHATSRGQLDVDGGALYFWRKDPRIYKFVSNRPLPEPYTALMQRRGAAEWVDPEKRRRLLRLYYGRDCALVVSPGDVAAGKPRLYWTQSPLYPYAASSSQAVPSFSGSPPVMTEAELAAWMAYGTPASTADAPGDAQPPEAPAPAAVDAATRDYLAVLDQPEDSAAYQALVQRHGTAGEPLTKDAHRLRVRFDKRGVATMVVLHDGFGGPLPFGLRWSLQGAQEALVKKHLGDRDFYGRGPSFWLQHEGRGFKVGLDFHKAGALKAIVLMRGHPPQSVGLPKLVLPADELLALTTRRPTGDTLDHLSYQAHHLDDYKAVGLTIVYLQGPAGDVYVDGDYPGPLPYGLSMSATASPVPGQLSSLGEVHATKVNVPCLWVQLASGYLRYCAERRGPQLLFSNGTLPAFVKDESEKLTGARPASVSPRPEPPKRTGPPANWPTLKEILAALGKGKAPAWKLTDRRWHALNRRLGLIKARDPGNYFLRRNLGQGLTAVISQGRIATFKFHAGGTVQDSGPRAIAPYLGPLPMGLDWSSPAIPEGEVARFIREQGLSEKWTFAGEKYRVKVGIGAGAITDITIERDRLDEIVVAPPPPPLNTWWWTRSGNKAIPDTVDIRGVRTAEQVTRVFFALGMPEPTGKQVLPTDLREGRASARRHPIKVRVDTRLATNDRGQCAHAALTLAIDRGYGTGRPIMSVSTCNSGLTSTVYAYPDRLVWGTKTVKILW